MEKYIQELILNSNKDSLQKLIVDNNYKISNEIQKDILISGTIDKKLVDKILSVDTYKDNEELSKIRKQIIKFIYLEEDSIELVLNSKFNIEEKQIICYYQNIPDCYRDELFRLYFKKRDIIPWGLKTEEDRRYILNHLGYKTLDDGWIGYVLGNSSGELNIPRDDNIRSSNLYWRDRKNLYIYKLKINYSTRSGILGLFKRY